MLYVIKIILITMRLIKSNMKSDYLNNDNFCQNVTWNSEYLNNSNFHQNETSLSGYL